MTGSSHPNGRATWFRERGLSAWEMMDLIRHLESQLERWRNAGLIHGSTHPSVGMEAIAVGVADALQPGDLIASTHRGHGHCLARGASPTQLIAELFGRASGYCAGKGGSMHLASRSLGILGTNGIVGSSIGVATGAALGLQLSKQPNISVGFFGEGATSEGIFHESLNLASIWRLPILYVCENNQYAQSARSSEMRNVPDLSVRASSYGIPGVSVDGMDVFAVVKATRDAAARARSGDGPTLLVAETYRYLGHMVGDTEMYRNDEEGLAWRERDPLEQLRTALIDAGIVDDDRLAEIHAAVERRVEDAEAAATAAAGPAPETAFTDVYGEVSPHA